MSQLIVRPLSSSSSLITPSLADSDSTPDLMLAEAIGFIQRGQRAQALEVVALLQLDVGLEASTSCALFGGLELAPTARDATQLLKDACAHAALGNREAGLACLVMALACRDAMFELPRAIERAVRALNVPAWSMSIAPKLPPLTITLS